MDDTIVIQEELMVLGAVLLLDSAVELRNGSDGSSHSTRKLFSRWNLYRWSITYCRKWVFVLAAMIKSVGNYNKKMPRASVSKLCSKVWSYFSSLPKFIILSQDR